MQFEDSGLNVLISSSFEVKDRYPRLRLYAAIEEVRIESFMVPLFQGGTQIALRPSPLTTADVAIRVMPVDPERRALVRALQAGVEEEAAAVHNDVLRGGAIERFVEGPDEDPWAAMVSALLTIRFPEVFGPKPSSWGPLLADRYTWASDAHIIHARHYLTYAPEDAGGRGEAAHNALNALIKGQNLGAPYFSYSNQLMGEMLGGLAALGSLYPDLVVGAEEQLAKWRGERPLQRSAGAIFSWQMSDPTLRRSGVVAPYRNTRGNLDERLARVIFRGQVDLARISLLPTSTKPAPPKATQAHVLATTFDAAEPIDGPVGKLASSLNETNSRSPEAPALQRPVLVKDDANKGRFGGAASRAGYTLSATFVETKRSTQVEILLLVCADRSLPPSYSDAVEFFLHSSFNPSRLKVKFRGHKASLTVRAGGGFTVGAWLPERRVELEVRSGRTPRCSPGHTRALVGVAARFAQNCTLRRK